MVVEEAEAAARKASRVSQTRLALLSDLTETVTRVIVYGSGKVPACHRERALNNGCYELAWCIYE
jgi:hypothetical protein